MTIHDHIRDEKLQKTTTMILIKKLSKYQLYHQTKLVIINILQKNKYCHLIKK